MLFFAQSITIQNAKRGNAMKNIKISIVVPIYNTSFFLNKCIESIVNQSYSKLEIILVNDGSTDNSLSICDSYASQDDRIIVISKENGGLSSARNAGLDVATGDFIGFVDSDDFVASDMYEQLLDAILASNADVAECGYYLHDGIRPRDSKKALFDDIVSGEYVCCRRQVVSYRNC